MASLITIWNECTVWQSLYVLLTLQQMTPWELSRFTISWLVSTWGWRVCVCGVRKETCTVCAVKITKSFLFKYAVITGNADWCSWVCMCFDSVDILCTVTVSLLANYHGKVAGQVTAGSLKETGDWTYAGDAARWHSPASLWRVTRYMTWLFVSRELRVSAERSCHVLLLWTSTPAPYCKLEVFSLRACMYS